VEEPKIENIFCEPIVNYNWDAGAEKFNSQLKVTNTDANAWSAAYTPGFTAGDGETIWGYCHALRQLYRDIEPCPPDFSDQSMLTLYADAVAYLTAKLFWMENKRIAFSVNYAKGEDYHFAQHVMLTLPHQTDGDPVECVIERVKKDKNNNLVELKLVILYTSLS
jgi:hypothetical protein